MIPKATVASPTTLEKLTEELSKCDTLLRCRDEHHEKLKACKTVAGVLKYYFQHDQPATYYAKNGSSQCTASRLRSLNDIYLLAKYYVPKATVVAVIACLSRRTVEENLRSRICGVLNQRVWGAQTMAHEGNKDELGMVLADYHSIRKTFLTKLRKTADTKLQAAGKRTRSVRTPKAATKR